MFLSTRCATLLAFAPLRDRLSLLRYKRSRPSLSIGVIPQDVVLFNDSIADNLG